MLTFWSVAYRFSNTQTVCQGWICFYKLYLLRHKDGRCRSNLYFDSVCRHSCHSCPGAAGKGVTLWNWCQGKCHSSHEPSLSGMLYRRRLQKPSRWTVSSPGSPLSSNSNNPFPHPRSIPNPPCPTPQPPPHHPLFWTKMESEIFGPDMPQTTVLQQNHQKNDVGCINGRRRDRVWNQPKQGASSVVHLQQQSSRTSNANSLLQQRSHRRHEQSEIPLDPLR